MSHDKQCTCRFLLLTVLLGASVVTAPAQAPPSISVQFVSRGMQPTLHEIARGDFSHEPSTGHIFMIVSVPTLHGPKEEAYGFYPKGDSLTGLIKGPGLTRSEYRCGSNDDCDPSNYQKLLKRMSESDASVRIPITEEDRRKIIGEVETWNHKEYRLTTDNCIDFVNAVVKDLGYPTPDRHPLQKPDKYLEELKPIIVAENQKREIERAQNQTPTQIQPPAPTRQNKNPDCRNGVFQELNPRFIWNLTFDGDHLAGQRTDGQCYFRLSRTGKTWTGYGTCGQQRLNLVMRANDGCTQLTSNLTIFCPVLNRK
jgi:hypothetical protein